MPRLRRRETARRDSRFEWAKLSLCDVLSLVAGRLYEKEQTIMSLADMEEAWHVNRDRLMMLDTTASAGMVSGGCKPGTRPPCWWLFEAPDDGLRVLGTNLTAHRSSECHGPGHDWSDDDGQTYTADQLESQADYLRRHRLLTADEISILEDQQ